MIHAQTLEPVWSKNFWTQIRTRSFKRLRNGSFNFSVPGFVPVLLIILVKFPNPTLIIVSKTQNAVFRSLIVGDYQTLHISHGILMVIL
jgi:hypothetical protein